MYTYAFTMSSQIVFREMSFIIIAANISWLTWVKSKNFVSLWELVFCRRTTVTSGEWNSNVSLKKERTSLSMIFQDCDGREFS